MRRGTCESRWVNSLEELPGVNPGGGAGHSFPSWPPGPAGIGLDERGRAAREVQALKHKAEAIRFLQAGQ